MTMEQKVGENKLGQLGNVTQASRIERGRIPGKYCFGKTPMQTFIDSLSLTKEKVLGQDYIDGEKKRIPGVSD